MRTGDCQKALRRNRSCRFWIVGLASAAIGLLTFQGAHGEEPALPPAAAKYDFQRDIRPILETSCVACHGSEKHKGEFRLDTREHLLRGGETGEAIKVRNSAASPLIAAVARVDKDTAMPPDKEKALSPSQVGQLRAWIDDGAPYPEGFVIRTSGGVTLDRDELAKLPPPANHKIDFVQEIQPLFKERCYSCHGPERQEAGFRLDHKQTFMSGGELGPAFVAGKSQDSLLVHLVAGLRKGSRMPKKGDPLSAEQIGLLRAWIDQGANFPEEASAVLKNAREHWAYQPPKRAAPPSLPEPYRSEKLEPLDQFVAARLAKEGLAFSPPAERTTLLRRVYLDLIGLPPTIAEVDAFLADTSADAYTKVVEKLLASPHYGERWGRHWLDAARYADSDGYEKDKARIAHFYRDWVIQAFNRDLPYDQFIIEQIAGDLLPHATQDQIVATGYLRNSMINEEGGIDPEQFRMEAMFDRMDAIGKGILGVGLNCCQCHNHKYDPFTQEDYYRLFAFLNNDYEAQPRVYAPDEWQKRADVLRQIGELENKLREENPDWREKMAAWEKEWRAMARPGWTVIRPNIDKNDTGGQRYLPQPDGSFLTAGYQPTKSTCNAAIRLETAGVTGIQVEMLHDKNLPAGGPGRSFLGTFGLSEFRVEARNKDGKMEKVKVASATADLSASPDTKVHPNFNEKKPVNRLIGPPSYALDGNNDTGWSSDLGPGRHNFESTIVFALEKPLDATDIVIQMVQNIGGWNSDDLQANQFGRFRISVTTSPNPVVDPVPPLVRAALDVPAQKRSPPQVATIFGYWRSTRPEWKVVNDKIEDLWKQHPEGTTQMTLSPREEMRPTAILKRGDWLKPGQLVSPGVPALLHPLSENAGTDRLTLAKWLVDRRSPTTARVFVNRVWQSYFGAGLVTSSEDFGTQSEAPSHPELLDWLAVEFMDHGWSVKHLHKVIVQSRTYRQSSQVARSLEQKDPYNRLLARGPRFRVEGEIVRDIQLTISGLLNPKLGGRAVMPPAPSFLFEPPASYAPFPWKEEQGEDRYRRAVYTWRRRTTPYPFLQTFDTPDANVACVRRGRANTPLQALMGLNETVSLEAARAFAKKILSSGGGNDGTRIEFAFRSAVARAPSTTEKDALQKLLEKQRSRIADGKLNAWQVATGREKESPNELPKEGSIADWASYTVVARVLLNLDETITKE